MGHAVHSALVWGGRARYFDHVVRDVTTGRMKLKRGERASTNTELLKEILRDIGVDQMEILFF